MSFKTYEQIQFAQSIYVPRPFTWENYRGLWLETRFPLWLRNSAITAVVLEAGTPAVVRPGGEAGARLRLPGPAGAARPSLFLRPGAPAPPVKPRSLVPCHTARP